MEDVRGKYVSPAVDRLAFNCPHCGALAKQFWFSVCADQLKADDKPLLVTADGVEKLRKDDLGLEERREAREEREELVKWAERMATGRPAFQRRDLGSVYFNVHNVSMSLCYNCNEVCVWIYDRLLWPRQPGGPLPNPDVPPEVRSDYEEASTILDASPRGAAALLRLAIQKLCKALGESGQNINDDIASLVGKELDGRVQRALDIVRVTGNNALHPGQIER